MSRKTKPSVHKPNFDEESILRFAAMEPMPICTGLQTGGTAPERSILSLHLKPEIINLLRLEADRKGKTVDQIVAKLVSKHLDKH